MRHHCKTLGGITVCIGVGIILAMVLPSAAWWLLLGVLLISLGLGLIKHGI